MDSLPTVPNQRFCHYDVIPVCVDTGGRHTRISQRTRQFHRHFCLSPIRMGLHLMFGPYSGILPAHSFDLGTTIDSQLILGTPLYATKKGSHLAKILMNNPHLLLQTPTTCISLHTSSIREPALVNVEPLHTTDFQLSRCMDKCAAVRVVAWKAASGGHHVFPS